MPAPAQPRIATPRTLTAWLATTGRNRGRDDSEISATKSAALLGLPIFVITPGATTLTRSLKKAWVEDWDDNAGIFLITFGEEPPSGPRGIARLPETDAPFELKDPPSRRSATMRAERPNQARFKFAVLELYGAGCAVCGVRHQRLIDAAHLYPKRDDGSDDPRNGLPLEACAA